MIRLLKDIMARSLLNIYEKFHAELKLQKRIIRRNNFTYRNLIEIIEKYLEYAKSVLDIGCGVGTVDFYLASQGCNVVGIDISKKAISMAKENSKTFGLEKRMRFLNISFPEESIKGKYNLIIASEVLEHLCNDGLAIKEMKDLLVEDGKIIISTPSSNAPLYRMGLLEKFDKRVGHKRRYSEKSLNKLISKAGLKVDRIIKTEGILRNALFTIKPLGQITRFIKGPISDIVTFLDNIAIRLFGESNIYIIASKDNSKKPMEGE